ncbi:hypothetical protein [Deinococcus hopiensis]|uniref:hypothetical protein n=1 Tax=Deinococcus hopiensis TaxID=309885 RepID=UPI000A0785A0|nr:hypothetical protein [Deinococcus hopiensis]
MAGLTALMLANNVAVGSRTPARLMHAPFGGVRLTDLVFPWFPFCAGAALPFSPAALRRAGVYPVGAFLTSVTEHRLLWGLGVLQLIALATLGGALLGGLRWR